MNSKIRNSYLPFFQMSKETLSPFFIEALTKSGYDAFVYLIDTTGPDCEWYFSEEEKTRRSKIGLNFYSDRKRADKLIIDGQKLRDEIKEYLATHAKDNLSDLNTDELKNLFKETYAYFCKYGTIYSFTEDTYTAIVDHTIKSYFIENFPDVHETNNYLRIILKQSKNEQDASEKRKTLQNMDMPEHISILCSNVAKIGETKFDLRSTWNILWALLDNILKEIANRNAISHVYIRQCFYREVLALLNRKLKDTSSLKNKCEERQNHFVATKNSDNKTWDFLSGKKAQIIIDAIRREIDYDVTEFSGDVASLGLIRGTVVVLPIGVGIAKEKIVNEKIEKMKKGDILVAQATGPEMSLAFNKAGAIICEWGGITSHAAVISRELGIPGIINTKIAMRVLKDGDYVEVDAINGIVRILKRA